MHQSRVHDVEELLNIQQSEVGSAIDDWTACEEDIVAKGGHFEL